MAPVPFPVLMFPRRFPWVSARPRAGGGVARPFGWVVRDVRTGRYWADPHATGKRAGDPRHDWRPRKGAYVFTSPRVALLVARDRGVSERVVVVPANTYHQRVAGRAHPELARDEDGDPLKRSGWDPPPPYPNTCTVQLIGGLVAGCKYSRSTHEKFCVFLLAERP